MSVVIREYYAKIDSKKRVTLRNTVSEYYYVKEMENGVIVLEPRDSSTAFTVSANTLRMMDESVKNLKKGADSEAVDLWGGRKRFSLLLQRTAGYIFHVAGIKEPSVLSKIGVSRSRLVPLRARA